MKPLITVVLMAPSAVPYSFFLQAFEMWTKEKYQVSGKDITQVYNWIQARKADRQWHNGARMKQEHVKEFMAQTYPIA